MMNETLLFDSLSSPVPEIRRDLQVIPIEDDGRNLLYFHDPMGYASPNFALDRTAEPLLSLINGRQSVNQILGFINTTTKPFDLLEFIQLLDHHRILQSKHFRIFANRIEKDFEKSSIRKPALAGDSYPTAKEEFETFMDRYFESSALQTSIKPVKALYAPHIDLRVGHKQYREAFASLSDLQPKRVVILATSHYAGAHGELYDGKPYIGSMKDYQIPGRLFETDREYIQALSDLGESSGFTTQDRAHRIEHSIELHLLWLSRIWKHSLRIVPILVGGLDELYYHKNGDLAQKTDQFTNRLADLDDEETFYLISGDLSHVGKKFGDEEPASELRQEIEKTDGEFIRTAEAGSYKELLNRISKSYDRSRICGFPPLYTFLKAFPKLTGESINYYWWDERERESAVSFGSIAY
ncbi:MAG: AmmeMemoRadiSam system protein B [Balneolaceae bacterium]|nr:AmmeMemoRadiSam system protein B [Balneolaceae bacterium]